MKYRFSSSLLAMLFFVLSCAPAAFAVDRDDDIAPDTEEHINYDESTNKSAESQKLEAQFPAEAKEVQKALEAHINHANTRDLDGYMGDFIADKMKYPELEREYAQRAMALKDLKLEVRAVEFTQLTKTAATVHTRQISRYTDDSGHAHVEDAVISYRWLKSGNTWHISFTERKHLVAE